MNNFNTPFGQNIPPQFSNYQQIQQMFPQPQGSVYAINTPSEVGNVPIGSTGLSVAMCFPDSLMYIKSFQNGNPVIMAYRITPYTKDAPTPPSAEETNPLEERLAKLEQILLNNNNNTKEGGKFSGLL